MIRNDRLLNTEANDDRIYSQDREDGTSYSTYYPLTVSWEEQMLLEAERELAESRSTAEITGTVWSLAKWLYSRLAKGTLVEGLCAEENEIVEALSDYYKGAPKTVLQLRLLARQAVLPNGMAAGPAEAHYNAELRMLAKRLLDELRLPAALRKETALQ